MEDYGNDFLPNNDREDVKIAWILHWIFPNDVVQCIRAAIPPSRFQFQPLGSPPIPKTVVGHFELPYWDKLSKQEVNQQNKILIEYLSKRLNG